MVARIVEFEHPALYSSPRAGYPNFFLALNKSGKRSGDIQSNNAKQAVADPTEGGAAIPSQPFEPKPRATLFSGEKVDRSTYTQSDPSGLRVVSNVAGENLLLRHSYCQKN